MNMVCDHSHCYEMLDVHVYLCASVHVRLYALFMNKADANTVTPET